jgi:hypothetical protein
LLEDIKNSFRSGQMGMGGIFIELQEKHREKNQLTPRAS